MMSDRFSTVSDRFSMISGSEAESIFMDPIHLSSSIAAKKIISEGQEELSTLITSECSLKRVVTFKNECMNDV